MEVVKPGSVMVGWIHPGMVHAPFMMSLINLMNSDARGSRRISNVADAAGTVVPFQRNAVAHNFMESGCEWLHFFDSDMTFQPDVLDKLFEIASPKRPIVTGLYFGLTGAVGRYRPIWFDGDYMPMEELPKEEKVQIGGAGAGCLLIHRSVMEKMATHEGGSPDGWHWFAYERVGSRCLGEDLTFCHRATKLGFPIWGHQGALCGHVKNITIKGSVDGAL